MGVQVAVAVRVGIGVSVSVGVAVSVGIAVGVRDKVGLALGVGIVAVGMGRVAHAPSKKLKNKILQRFIVLARTKTFHRRLYILRFPWRH